MELMTGSSPGLTSKLSYTGLAYVYHKSDAPDAVVIAGHSFRSVTKDRGPHVIGAAQLVDDTGSIQHTRRHRRTRLLIRKP